jgi:hypothetical protein
MRDYILKEKVFEESIHMSFGTAIHEAIQHYLETLYTVNEAKAEAIDLIPKFEAAFIREITSKKINYKPEDYAEFVEDGKAIIEEFKAPENRRRYFPKDKWSWIGVEVAINEHVVNHCSLTCRLDLVLKDTVTGDIRIVDFKTATNKWTNYAKEDFTKTSQLLLYKAAYSKKFNVPLSKIHVEFIILSRKLYANANYEQSRIQIFKPPASQTAIVHVLQEVRGFVEECFSENGEYNTSRKYLKIPGKNKTNCKYCPYAKNGKCDQVPDIVEK